MKFAMVSSLEESNRSDELILKRFSELCELLKPIGYKGIELAILEPEKIPALNLKEIADSYQIKIPALGTGATFLRFRYSLGDLYLRIRQSAINRIARYIEFATITNSKVIIGLIRGRRTFKNTPSVEARNLHTTLTICSKLAEEYDVELLLEPINRFEIDSCNTIKETLDLIEDVGSDHLQLMVDTFHIHLEEDLNTIWSYLELISSRVSHIHLADDTRSAPGTGHFDFPRFLKIFQKNKFSGFASIETIMKPTFEGVARVTMSYFKKINIL